MSIDSSVPSNSDNHALSLLQVLAQFVDPATAASIREKILEISNESFYAAIRLSQEEEEEKRKKEIAALAAELAACTNIVAPQEARQATFGKLEQELLMLAIRAGNVEVAKRLIDSAVKHEKNEVLVSSLREARDHDQSDVTQYVMQKVAAKPDSQLTKEVVQQEDLHTYILDELVEMILLSHVMESTNKRKQDQQNLEALTAQIFTAATKNKSVISISYKTLEFCKSLPTIDSCAPCI